MDRRLIASVLVTFLLTGFLEIGSAIASGASDTGRRKGPLKPVESLNLFRARKFDAHYRTPNNGQIELILRQEGIPLTGPFSADASVENFKQEWLRRNPSTPNPRKLRRLLERERTKSIARRATPEAATEFRVLVVPVEFPNSDTFDHCGSTVTTSGVLHNQMAAPGPRDNTSVWYENTTPGLYNELYFGIGPKAGVVIDHPNLGKMDLRGSTMANYYLEQSGGTFVPKGLIYPKWLQAAHSEGWYGADGCSNETHNIRAQDLVKEAVDLVNTDDPSFEWQHYDADGDGIVDNFTVLHAGAGQEAGGGTQGAYAIWSHASTVNYPAGYLACSKGSTGCPDRNVYVREYSMDPENVDVGVISEEFGHAVFGLPDIYTTDYQASPSNWAIFEAGSWNGRLAGMQPAPYPLWARYLVGWAYPSEVDYTTNPVTIRVGQHSLPPKNTESGIKINLPDQEVTVENKTGSGKGWWSDVGDLTENTLTRTLYLPRGPGVPEPNTLVFSFDSYWSIEQEWDYGYVEISSDSGSTWITLNDIGGLLTVANPNGTNQGWGLTGEGSGTLSFDLGAYKGKAILFRLRYSTDVATQWQGWWVDNFRLVYGSNTFFVDDVEGGTNGWTAEGWLITPLTRTYPLYYLVEWRNLSGFDHGLAYPYQTVYSAENEWEVDRCPYAVPGMLLWMRNTLYKFDYTLGESWYQTPSIGPKHALLVVDSHYWPMTWDNFSYTSGAKLRISSRCQPADAAFTLKRAKPFTLRLGYDPLTGQYAETPFETKTFGPTQPIGQFHDSLGYYPGLWYSAVDDSLYFWQVEAGAAIPARAIYTTRVTDMEQKPYPALYGYSVGGGNFLGTGNPGDSHVQHGLHLAISRQSGDGKWGEIAVWNSQTLTSLDLAVDKAQASPKDILKYTLTVTNPSPVKQAFTVYSPIPTNTTYKSGGTYNRTSKTVVWSGTVNAGKSKSGKFSVMVNEGTPSGMVIQHTSTLSDSALGDTASVMTTVK